MCQRMRRSTPSIIPASWADPFAPRRLSTTAVAQSAWTGLRRTNGRKGSASFAGAAIRTATMKSSAPLSTASPTATPPVSLRRPEPVLPRARGSPPPRLHAGNTRSQCARRCSIATRRDPPELRSAAPPWPGTPTAPYAHTAASVTSSAVRMRAMPAAPCATTSA